MGFSSQSRRKERSPQMKADERSDQDLPPDSLARLDARLLAFARERDWEQFQSPKNLAMALAGEAGELLEHFQWLTEEQSANLDADKCRAVAHELADILNYLVRLAERLGIDLLAAADEKIAINEQRYPADKVRGDARRAAEYES
jgi:dCTP diphosphatase